jgi:hypothetical protein
MGLPPTMTMKIDRVPTQSRKRQRPSLVFLRLRPLFFKGVVVPLSLSVFMKRLPTAPCEANVLYRA